MTPMKAPSTFDHIGGTPTPAVGVEAGPPAAAAPEASGAGWWAWARTPTGPGPIRDYTEHPANWNRSPAVARLLRGITGFLGASDFAILDILVGLLELWQSRRPQASHPDEFGDFDAAP